MCIMDTKYGLCCRIVATDGFGVATGSDITFNIKTRQVGKGMYGSVYSCESARFSNIVVKIFFQQHPTPTKEDWPPTIVSEILGLEATGLQYILCQSNNTYYLVLRNYGKSIHKIWKDKNPYGGYTIPHFLSLLGGVREFLGLLHSQGLVHGDVKGSNMLLGSGRITLIDYGLCHDEKTYFCTSPFTSEQLTPGAQYGLAYHKVCDPRALLVVIFHLLLKGTPCCEKSMTKRGKEYRFKIVSESLLSPVHKILQNWPKLRDAVLAAHAEVVEFDETSLHTINTVECKKELAGRLKTLSAEYYEKLSRCVELIISTSAAITSSRSDATLAGSTNSDNPDSPPGASDSVSSVSSVSSDSSEISKSSANPVSADSSNSSS